LTLFVKIREVIDLGSEYAVQADINGVDWSFNVPINTNFGGLRDIISQIVVDEPLPENWQREFSI
jgi:hypothetical protein